ncbi:MAG: hypothetical protein HY718_08280 [Planctomycetes bacterium]|nr:hypothetical protein [Planctomycetota bacterium]
MRFVQRWNATVRSGLLLPMLVLGCSLDLNTAAPQAAEAVEAAFPNARLVKASSELEGGLRVYEATLTEDGRTTDVLLTAEGTIIEVETEVDLTDLPSTAAERLRTIVGDGKMTKLEKVEVRARVETGSVVPLDPPSIFYEVKYWRGGLPGEKKVGADGGDVGDD